MSVGAPGAGRYAARLTAALGLLLQVVGCGTTDLLLGATGDSEGGTVNTQSCAAAPAPEEAGTLVVLDWDGGINELVRGRELSAFEVDDLYFTDTAIDSDDLEVLFAEAVLGRVRAILCSLDPMDVAVIEGEADDYPDATVVHICGDEPFADGKHIGQADFDPCNANLDDSVVIWGGALATRIGGATFGGWVNALAKTTAHEIGHTLGFAHPSEQTVAMLLPVPSAEVMRSNVTVSQLLGEQNFLIEQETCPGSPPGSGSYRLVGRD